MRAGIFAASALLALIGCGSDASPARTITAGDITPIPPGTAVGSLFSGAYVIRTGGVEACRCRVGSCATVGINVGGLFTVVQTDGTVQISNPNALAACTGGVDSDGSFRCNGAVDQPGNMIFGLSSGQFMFSGGAVSSLHDTQEITATLPTVDCDIRIWGSSQYIGPSALVAIDSVAARADREAAQWLTGLVGFSAGP